MPQPFITETMMRPTRSMVMLMRMMKKFDPQKMVKIDQVHQVRHLNLKELTRSLRVALFSGLDDEELAIHTSEIDPNLIWPSMQDLNTRLRRVITSYQRNYKKEELKQQQKAKVGFQRVIVIF